MSLSPTKWYLFVELQTCPALQPQGNERMNITCGLVNMAADLQYHFLFTCHYVFIRCLIRSKARGCQSILLRDTLRPLQTIETLFITSIIAKSIKIGSYRTIYVVKWHFSEGISCNTIKKRNKQYAIVMCIASSKMCGYCMNFGTEQILGCTNSTDTKKKHYHVRHLSNLTIQVQACSETRIGLLYFGLGLNPSQSKAELDIHYDVSITCHHHHHHYNSQKLFFL